MSLIRNEFNKRVRKCLERYAKKYEKNQDSIQLGFFLKENLHGFSDGYKILVDFVPVKNPDGSEAEVTIKNVLDITTVDFQGMTKKMPPVIVSILVSTAERLNIEAAKINVIAVMQNKAIRLCVYNGKSTYVEDLSEEDILETFEFS